MLDVLEPWLRSADLVEQVRDIARLAATRASDLDQDGSFPTEDIHALAAIGALKAPMPPAYGGLGLGARRRRVRLPCWMCCAGSDTAASRLADCTKGM